MENVYLPMEESKEFPEFMRRNDKHPFNIKNWILTILAIQEKGRRGKGYQEAINRVVLRWFEFFLFSKFNAATANLPYHFCFV